MTSIAASHFRAHLPEYLHKAQNGETTYITSHGKKIACLTPVENPQQQARKRLDAIKSQCYIGDIITPIDMEWEAMK